MADKRADSGSESDSTEDPVVGNVNKFAVVPPNYNGKPKKGHLIFDACFESGNLGRVDYITEFEYDLFIRPDTCNPRFRVWFNFTVENVKQDQRVIFNIVNFSKTKSLYRDGMTPLVKSTSRPKWVRIPTKYVYYYRCPDHRKNYVMSFAFNFDSEDEVYQFAYCYPYSYTRLQNYLDNLEKRNYDFFTRELLCLTVQQRRLDLLTITHPDNLYTPEGEKQKMVYITARVHPGETPSSFVCQGVIDFLVSNHPIAKILREHLVFKIIPCLNPDGVYLGNYRCSLMGFDLNRHWQEPSPWAHPTLYSTKNMLMELDRSGKYEVDFYIDLHAHSTLMNGFMYGNIYDDVERYEKQSIFPKLLGANAEDFSLANTNFNRDAIKAGTGRRTLGGCLDESHCYTLEVSFYSYTANSTGQSTPYTEEAYMKLGRNLARTFLDYYKLMGYISAKPSSSVLPKPGATRPRPDRRQADRGERGDPSAFNNNSSASSGAQPTERAATDPAAAAQHRERGGGHDGPGGGGGQFGGGGGGRFDRGLNREEPRSFRRGELSLNGTGSTFAEPGTLQRPRRF
ncbi:cytosolic carboxypeptidase 6-like [Babylonia areolata]|uniref:cytosolic carboxypeptidase 6-like n=1 Tax=Babylonia areolata TaxID=304850 RepID=UPI003FD55165